MLWKTKARDNVNIMDLNTFMSVFQIRSLFFCFFFLIVLRASQVAQMVKNLPAMWETRVRSLGQEDLLEKGMATHSSILAWRIPWTEESGGLYSPWVCKELDMTVCSTNTCTHIDLNQLFYILPLIGTLVTFTPL